MIRHTKLERILPKVDNDGTEHWVEYIKVEDKDRAGEKLFQFENTEEEIGVDLNKLLSAKEVYYMDWKNSKDDTLCIATSNRLALNLTTKRIEVYETEWSDIPFELDVKHYGRNDIWGGWAFTKEELL